MRELLFAAAAVVVQIDGARLATISPAESAPPLTGEVEERTLYSTIPRDSPLGVITFHRPWRDARGQAIRPGKYRMRYAVQPLLKDHAGTSLWRDFVILTRDGEPSSGHPRVIALVPPADGNAVLVWPHLRIGVELEALTADSAF